MTAHADVRVAVADLSQERRDLRRYVRVVRILGPARVVLVVALGGRAEEEEERAPGGVVLLCYR